MQVFGRNPWLWFVPFTGRSGKPVGDGVVWSLMHSNLEDEVPANEGEERRNSTIGPGTGNLKLMSPKSPAPSETITANFGSLKKVTSNKPPQASGQDFGSPGVASTPDILPQQKHTGTVSPLHFNETIKSP